MSAGFRAVQWNRAKLVYDSILLASVALYISSYLILAYWLDPPKDLPAAIDLRIRAFGTCAFFMLTIILSIGPLARLDRRFLPLLYNRRHFGVLTLFIVFVHASFMVELDAVQDAVPSLYDELTKVSDYGKSAFPSRRSASLRSSSCSCWRRPATTIGSSFSRRRSGRVCTWRSTSRMRSL